MRFLRICIAFLLFVPGVLSAEEAATSQSAREQTAQEKKRCECENIRTVTNAFEFADMVFAGKVIDIRLPDPGKEDKRNTTIAFEIIQFWKGDLRRQVVLYRSELFEPECNYPFEEGKEYLVFVDQTALDVYRERYVPPGGKILNSTVCSRTKLLEEAETEQKVLGVGNIPE